MCFTIRKAVLEDLGPALALDREVFGVDAWTVMDYIGVFSNRGVKKFTAETDGKFAGFAASELDRSAGAVCLLTLAVDPQYQRRGIGRSLLGKIESAFGDQAVYLYVDAKNETAIRLYRRSGYAQTDVIPGYYMNGHDALVFNKDFRESGPEGSAS